MLARKHVSWHDVIQPGLDKLLEYEEELERTPAYVLAMGIVNTLILSWTDPLAIDPGNKLKYYSDLSQAEFNSAKNKFLKAVSYSKSFHPISNPILFDDS